MRMFEMFTLKNLLVGIIFGGLPTLLLIYVWEKAKIKKEKRDKNNTYKM